MFLVEPDKLDIKRHIVFYLSCIISWFNGEKTVKQNENEMQFCSNLPTWRMDYDVN